MNKWLQRFAYNAPIDARVLVYAGAVALLAASATVSCESFKAAAETR